MQKIQHIVFSLVRERDLGRAPVEGQIQRLDITTRPLSVIFESSW